MRLFVITLAMAIAQALSEGGADWPAGDYRRPFDWGYQ